MSGIGGQGIIVGTKLIGITATGLGQYALHYAEYGGEMRGTRCECTLTVADKPVTSTPQVSNCEAAIIMHPESFDRLVQKLLPGGLALVNSSLIDVSKLALRKDVEWLLVPATDLGTSLGHAMVSTMVAIGAFAEETQLVPAAAIADHLSALIPPYRHQLLEMDAKGIEMGANCVATGEQVSRIPATEAPYHFARTGAVASG
ncbi:MAG TPA: 2-oxoacid:acceptor oxidoreductase family protein, partial [Dehalococcoidia bacterium]|nr:2-oxoacid:acceptor oxidoreductase family protein [Dehalococcoidia bacterium]